MAYDVTADLAFMFADLPGAATVICGASVTYGAFDHADVIEEDRDGAQIQARRPVLTLKRGSLAGLTRGATVSVNGDSYKVREIQRIDDGAIVQVILVEAT